MEELQKLVNQLGTIWLRISLLLEDMNKPPAQGREYTYEDWLNEGGALGKE